MKSDMHRFKGCKFMLPFKYSGDRTVQRVLGLEIGQPEARTLCFRSFDTSTDPRPASTTPLQRQQRHRAVAPYVLDNSIVQYVFETTSNMPNHSNNIIASDAFERMCCSKMEEEVEQ